MVRIYVEGGGDGDAQKRRCREGFSKLLAQAGLQDRMPRVVACGGQTTAFDKFKTALYDLKRGEFIVLLIDSEDPVIEQDPWRHLKKRDDWEKPAGATNKQVQLMVTCMETWLVADRAALREFFGEKFNEKALPARLDLEQHPRGEVQAALARATQACERQYAKGKRSFEILARLNPETLKQHLPHFNKLLEALKELCK